MVGRGMVVVVVVVARGIYRGFVFEKGWGGWGMVWGRGRRALFGGVWREWHRESCWWFLSKERTWSGETFGVSCGVEWTRG